MIEFLSSSAKKEIYPRESCYLLKSTNLERQKLISLLFHQVVLVRGQNARKLQYRLWQRTNVAKPRGDNLPNTKETAI